MAVTKPHRSPSGLRLRITSRCWLLVLVVSLTGACGDGNGSPTVPEGALVVLELSVLRALDPATEGAYRAWVLDAAGTAHDAGPLLIGGSAPIEFTSPISNGTGVEITVEPPPPRAPSAARQVLLRGSFRRGIATLTVEGALTNASLPLREKPGQFTMFTPSDNLRGGYPSHEESGIWLFNMAPRDTDQNDMWVRLTPLTPGWVYEGWMVRDFGQPGAIWLSYGKFLPDATGAVNTRDDTGWGPFSGVLNFQTAGEEEFPGDDWISNPLSLPFPPQLTLPLDLREKQTNGQLRWTHIITIEPASDRAEPIGSERPFLLDLYRDPFGDGGPGGPRIITFRRERVPSGTARVQ